MTIAKGYQQNLATLARAIISGDAGLMECTDAETDKPVVIICAFQHDPYTQEVTTVPLAKMFDGNPYEQLIPPNLPPAHARQ
jgi:hypothetical protein